MATEQTDHMATELTQRIENALETEPPAPNVEVQPAKKKAKVTQKKEKPPQKKEKPPKKKEGGAVTAATGKRTKGVRRPYRRLTQEVLEKRTSDMRRRVHIATATLDRLEAESLHRHAEPAQ